MADNDPAEIKRQLDEAAAASAKLLAELTKLTAQLASIDQTDPFSNFLGEVDTLKKQIADITKAYEKAAEEQAAVAVRYGREQEKQLEKEGQLERAVWQKLFKDQAEAEAKAAKEAEKLQADQFAAAAKVAKQYFDELAKEEVKREQLQRDQYAAAASAMKAYYAAEAAEAKAMAKKVSEMEDLRVQQYKAATKAMKEFYAAEEKEEKAKKAREAEEWADLIETRETLDAQDKKDTQAVGGALKASSATGAEPGAVSAIAGGTLSAVAGLAGAAVSAASALKGLVDQAAAYVRYSDPAAVLMMTMAMEDLQAAIGSGLSPVVNAFTVFLDRANAAITQFQPIIEAISAVVSGVFLDMAKEAIALGEAFMDLALSEIVPVVVVMQALWEAVKPLVASTVDLVQEFARFNLDFFMSVFEVAAPVIQAFMEQISNAAKGLAFMAKVVGILIEAIRTGRFDRIGGQVRDAARDAVAGPGARPAAGGVTTAARPATQISSEAIGEQARAAAFSGRSIAEQQLEVAQQQSAQLQQLINNTRPGAMALPVVSVDPPQP